MALSQKTMNAFGLLRENFAPRFSVLLFLSPQFLESDVIKLSHSHKRRIEAFLGARRKITCEFHGSPPITVTWTKKGLDKLPSRVENHGASLLIKKVSLSDAGQYICNASNAFSSGTSYVNVSVYGKKSV